MTRNPEIFGTSIVALGAFNPAIVTPDWLEQNKLLGTDDAKAARDSKNYFTTREVSLSETAWFILNVGVDKFSLASKAGVNPAVKDLALGIFTLLPHTPVTAIGLNFMAHYKIENEADYHKIGDVLAPKTIWDQLSDKDHSAGMENLTIKIQKAKRGEKVTNRDMRRFIVEPSTKVVPGVFFALNHHREIKADQDNRTAPAETAAKVISEEWDGICKEAPLLFEKIISSCLSATK